MPWKKRQQLSADSINLKDLHFHAVSITSALVCCTKSFAEHATNAANLAHEHHAVTSNGNELRKGKVCTNSKKWNLFIEGSLNRNFRQYGELKSSSRVIKSVDRRCNSQKVRRKKISPRQMLEKSRNAVFFHRFVCRVSPKVGLLKRRVRR